MRLVEETGLDAFRRDELSPEAVLRHVERDVRVLMRLGLGVGKSHAVDELLSSSATHDRFDLVVYAAPTWNIIKERRVVRTGASLVPYAVLEPRPVDRCGPYAERWSALEQRGCHALAKATLCRECNAKKRDDPCPWPGQIRRLEGVRLVFCTEQHLVLNRTLIQLLTAATGARRVLVILDEAQIVDRPFEVAVTDDELRMFAEVVRRATRPQGVPSGLAATWVRDLEALRVAPSADLPSARFSWSPKLNRFAHQIQKVGVDAFGPAFRYVGYDLVLLKTSAARERWKDTARSVRFVARPWLGVHLLMLSAHLRAAYVAHRLGVTRVASPFEGVRFAHTGTRVVNLRSRLGADQFFVRNRKQILDTFAVLIARNVAAGCSTLLVSRLKSKEKCAAEIGARLKGWGLEVRFVVDGGAVPAVQDPRVIPVIHYGVLGVNDYAAYEAVYCLNSYYVAEREVAAALQEALPRDERRALRIRSKPDCVRRVEVADAAGTDLDLLGNAYLQKLELDPVLQAVGRVRFQTKAREVVLFAMHDVTHEIPRCTTVTSLEALRQTLGVPPAKDVDAALEAEHVKALLAEGYTAAEVAAEIGVSRRTVFERIARAKSAKDPLKELKEGILHSDVGRNAS